MTFRRIDVSFRGHRFFPSHAASSRCVLSAAAPCCPAGVVLALAEPSSWRTGVVLVAAGVVSRPLLPTPLRILVDHHLPHCVSVGTWSVGLLFLHGALDRYPFFPARAASGRCNLTAAAVCVPAGVVSASAEPSSWHTGAVLVGVVVGVGVVLRFLLPTPLRTQVVHTTHPPPPHWRRVGCRPQGLKGGQTQHNKSLISGTAGALRSGMRGCRSASYREAVSFGHHICCDPSVPPGGNMS